MKTQNDSVVIDYVYNDEDLYSGKDGRRYSAVSDELLLRSLKVIAFLILISGLFAMVFEVRHYAEQSLQVYFTRLLAILTAFSILALLQFSSKKLNPVLLVHILLLSIIISSGYMIYLLPSTLIINSNIVGLMIFTASLFLSWELKNQIIVAIYYNIVFAAALLLNDGSIYTLPNMFESVLFVMFLSIVSVIGSSINYKLRSEISKQTLRYRLSQKKYEAIFNNSIEGIYQSTPEGKFLTVNNTLVALLGYDSAEELKGINIETDLYKNVSDRRLFLEKLKESGEVKNYRVALKKKDGNNIIAGLSAKMIKSEANEKYYYEGTVEDITAQAVTELKKKKIEEELKEEKIKSDSLAKKAMEANETKTQFLANMSHEIRTPMNGIIGFLSLIERESYKDKTELGQFASSARSSAESLLEIINEILDFSKIESGKVILQESEFNLLNVLDESVGVISPKLNEKKLALSREIAENTNLKLIGDSTRLRQILVNLLSNAVKFTDKGGIKIKIKSEDLDEENSKIYFTIEDTGIGIPKDKTYSLFKPFSQIDGSHTRKYGGTGLGLAISKEYAAMMGGEIGVNSEEGKGSSFYFTVKMKKDKVKENTDNYAELNKLYAQHGVSQEAEAQNSAELKKTRNKYNILLAEDNPVNQKVLTRFLTDAGYNVNAVANGIEAINSVQAIKYDLILMDIQMPEMDGLTATTKIREFNGNEADMPIIAITAHALIGDKEKCMAAGMNDYLSKPVSYQTLISVLDKWLGIGLDNAPLPEAKKKEAAIVDFEYFDSISLSDIEFQIDLASTYINDTIKRIDRLEEYSKINEISKAIAEAHTIKGASFSTGAQKMGEKALGIETALKRNDIENIEVKITEIRGIYEETKTAYEEKLGIKIN